eukprot:4602432-Amphidinium_carterae.1
MDDMREIDDSEALKVWSELSELDPKIRGDTYVTEDGSQWNLIEFSDLVDDLRVVRERRERSREAAGVSGTSAAPGGRQEEAVPMEVGTGRKWAAEEEADDSERAAPPAADMKVLTSAGKQGRGMLALSLLLADGATVLDGQSRSEVHDEFIDGRGCVYLNLSTLDTAVDEYTGMELPREGVITARHEEM